MLELRVKEEINAIRSIKLLFTLAIQESKPLGTAVCEQNLFFNAIFIFIANDFQRQKNEEFFLPAETAVTGFLEVFTICLIGSLISIICLIILVATVWSEGAAIEPH